MASRKKIRIRRAYSDGTLRLRREILIFNIIPATDVKVEERDKVLWINESEDVQSIEGIELEDAGATDEVFSVKPRNRGDGVWEAEIKQGASERGKGKAVDYKYVIYWKDKSGVRQTYDPKLTIKPSAGLIEGSIEWPLALFSGLAYLIQWRRKRMEEKSQQSVIE
jgi:hypothetical protein